MDPARLRDILAVLSEAGVRRAKVASDDAAGRNESVEVEFGGTSAAAPTFVDPRTGHTVDLSEGAGELASENVDEEIAKRNFAPEPKK